MLLFVGWVVDVSNQIIVFYYYSNTFYHQAIESSFCHQLKVQVQPNQVNAQHVGLKTQWCILSRGFAGLLAPLLEPDHLPSLILPAQDSG